MNTSKKFVITTTIILALSLAGTAQADGFFSKLLGGTTGSGAGFKTLLSHVPADTPYLLANKNPIPKEVMDFHLGRGQEMMKMISDLEEKSKEKKAAKGPDAFMKALFDDLGGKVSEGKIEDSGLSLKVQYLIYGYNTIPVVRLTFSDKEKLMATLKRAEESSGYKIELAKCGDYDCFLNTAETGDKSVAIVILKDHIATSLFSPDQKEAMVAHLSGKADPKEAYSATKWDEFLKTNNYSGFGDGFINLKSLYESNKELIAAGIQMNAKEKMDEKEQAACMAVAEDHLNNVPEIILGTKTMQAKKMDYEIVVKTSADVSGVLQGIANKTNIAKRLEKPILDLGVNINFIKLRDAMTQYSNFLLKSAEAHKCTSIKTKDVRKGMGGMMMAMNMGLTQFKSFYVSLANIELDEKMSPKNVEAFVSIGADDPAGLIGMVGMMSPALMGFQVPADGSIVELPKGAIPSKGMPLPPIFLNRSDKALNIMVGNNKPALKDYKGEVPEILSFAMDGQRYYKLFSDIMKIIPQPPSANDTDPESVSKMMEAMGNMSGKTQQEVTADQRGLVINYHIQY